MVRPSIYTQEEMDQFIAHRYWDRANCLDFWERNADKYPDDEAVVDSQSGLTPLLHKDASESNGCSYKKAVSNLFGILSKGLS